MKRPFTVFGGMLILSTVAVYCASNSSVLAVFAALCVAALILLHCKKLTAAKTATVMAGALVSAVILFGYFNICVYTPSLALNGVFASITGSAVDYIYDTDGKTLIIKNCIINGMQSKYKILIDSEMLSDDIAPFDTVSISGGKITADDSSGIFSLHLLSDGCWLTVSDCESINFEKNEKPPLSAYIINFRKYTKDVLAEQITDEHCTSIANALLSGSTNGLSRGFRTALSISGASHIFAVSGMHLSLWSGILLFLLERRAKNKLFANLITGAFVVAYTFFTGLSPSVIRSGIMLIIVLTGKIIHRKSDPLNSLGIACTLMLICNPCLAGNISFLLSVLSTAAIAGPLPNAIHSEIFGKDRIKGTVFHSVLCSFTVLLFTAPVCAAFFGQISLLTPVSSLLLTLPAEGVMITSFLCVMTANIPFIGRLFAILCTFCTGAVSHLTDFLSNFDFAVCPIEGNVLFLWYAATAVAGITVYFIFGKRKNAVLHTTLLSAALLLILSTVAVIVQRNDVHLYFPNNSEDSPLVITAECGATAVLIGGVPGYGDIYSIDDFYTKHSVFNTDFTVFTKDVGDNDFDRYRDRLNPDVIYAPSFITSPENTHRADYLQMEIAENISCTYTFINSCFAAILNIDGIKYVYLPTSDGDYTNADEALKSGDRLICCGGVPTGIDASCFEYVTVLTKDENGGQTDDILIRIRNGEEKCLL